MALAWSLCSWFHIKSTAVRCTFSASVLGSSVIYWSKVSSHADTTTFITWHHFALTIIMTTKKELNNKCVNLSASCRNLISKLPICFSRAGCCTFYSSVNCSSFKHIFIVIPTINGSLRSRLEMCIRFYFPTYCHKAVINHQRHSN